MAAIMFAGGDGIENRGRVTVLERPGAPFMDVVTLPGWGGFSGFKSIITGVELQEQGNFQFQHTLGNEIFVYIFGDRIGSFGVSGLAFYDTCGPFGAAFNEPGITRVLRYYRANRLANRAAPLLITIQPALVARCYLTGFRGRIADPALRLFEFHLQLAMIPEGR